MVNDIPEEEGINARIRETIADFGLILVEDYLGVEPEDAIADDTENSEETVE